MPDICFLRGPRSPELCPPRLKENPRKGNQLAQTLFIPKEIDPIESRVAATPETVKKFIGLGLNVIVEKDAGKKSRISDDEFSAVGARIGSAADAKSSDIILKVRRPNETELKTYKSGAALFAMLDPHGQESTVAALAKAETSAFTMEFMPRITRAQVMDVLSSQANLAGYQAVIDAAGVFDRAIPMMMTAAGTVPAARVFVMGAGVAGLQAIATARRLGAVVTATDVRPAAKEQVASLGAKFIAVEDDEFRVAETAGGYAKQMSKDYQAKQAALVADHIAKQDIVITTALIPGRAAPRLVTKEMVASMRPGSVLIDLAVERGGNVEGSVAGQVVDIDGVKIVGHLNVPGKIAATASQLYARNLFAFVETMIDKETGVFSIDPEEELARATLLTHGGKIVHPAFSDVLAAPTADAISAEEGTVLSKEAQTMSAKAPTKSVKISTKSADTSTAKAKASTKSTSAIPTDGGDA